MAYGEQRHKTKTQGLPDEQRHKGCLTNNKEEGGGQKFFYVPSGRSKQIENF